MNKKFLLATVSISLLQLLTMNVAGATDYSVSSTTDSGANSLRSQLTTATSGAGTHQVHFHGLVGTNETITLSSDLPTLIGSATNLTIGGTGGTYGYGGTGHVTVDGRSAFKVANITSGTVNFVEVALNGPIVNSGTGVSITQSFDSTNAGVISGTGTVTKAGTGALTLSGVNTYTGATTVSGGTLKLSDAGKLAATAVSVSSGATLDINGTTQTIDAIAGAGTVAIGSGSLTTSTASNTTFSGTLTGAANGSLTKAGSGALTLTADTTNYLGSLTVTGGKVIGSATNLPKAITNTGANVTFNNTSAATYAGVISGTGNVVMDGVSGNVTLSAAQTYTGGTTLTNGTITLGVDNALPAGKDVAVNSTLNLNDKSQTVGALTGAGTITLGAGSLQADSGTFSGVVSGTGKLAKSSAGTLTLSGANTYTGGTSVNAGTLAGTVTNLQGDISIADGATVAITQSSAGVYAGKLSGAGALTKLGADNLTLSADSTDFTGTATISAGTLTVQTSTLANATVVNNGTLAFSQTTNGTYGKVISGTGGITKLGTGEVTLSGVNTYTGNNTITAGKLIGTTDSIKGNITNNAALVLDQNTNAEYASVLSGSGTFEKKGLGTITMSGTSTNNGAATITAGKLYVTGSMANPTTVAAGATLGGTGTTAAITNNGNVSFGIDPTTTSALSMDGNYSQGATGKLHVKLGATTVNDYLDVDSSGSGVATLAAGSKVVIYPKAGQTYAAGNTFDVIRTSTTVANPTNVTVVSGNLIPLNATPSASGNNLRVTVDSVPAPLTTIANTNAASSLVSSLANSTVLNGASDFSNYIMEVNSLSTDQDKVAALENLAGGKRYGSASATLNALGGVSKLGVNALNSVSTAASAASLVANSSQNIELSEVQSLLALNNMDIKEEINNASKSNPIKNYTSSVNRSKMHRSGYGDYATVWVKGLYDRYTTNNTANNAGYRANTGAVVIGRNNILSPEDKVGFFGGYGQTNVKYKLDKGKTKAKHYLVGVNMANENGDMPITYGVTAGITRYNDKRNLVVGAISETATSKHKSYNLALNGEIAKNLYQGDVLVKPKFGLELFSQWHQAYSETGTIANNMQYKKKVAAALDIKPGVEVSKIIKGDNLTIMPSVGLTYIYTADIGSKTNKQTIVDQGISFNTRVKNDSKHALGINVGLAARSKENSEFAVKYEGTVKQKAREHQVSFNAEWKL